MSRGTGRLRRVDRILVAALSSALPAHFRARQRAEWTADLLALAGGPARWRYLFGAAWTLPTLRALARRAHVDGPPDVLLRASPSVVLLARVLMISLGWTVVSWLIMIPGRYLVFDIPARMAAGVDSDPKSIWPAGEGHGLLLPLLVLLYWGALAAVADFPLIPAVALIAVILVVAQRRQPWEERVRVAVIRATVIMMAAMLLTSLDGFVALMTGSGPALSLTGLGAAGLGLAGKGLSRGRRVLLGVLGLAAVAVAVIDNTTGSAMVVWFRD